MRTLLLTAATIALSACGSGGGENEQAPASDIRSMLIAGNPEACAATGIIDEALGVVSKEYSKDVAQGMPSLPADTISATGMNRDINEITCQATITYSSPLLDDPVKQGLVYKLRPALDSKYSVVIEVLDGDWINSAALSAKRAWEGNDAISKTEVAQGYDASSAERRGGERQNLAFGRGFASYPANVFAGSVAPLRLTSDQRTFGTRLKEAYSQPIDFGGSLSILQIGCGTGCTFAYALDKSSGRVFNFPVGGEEYQYLTISTRADSGLAWAGWQSNYDPKECRAQAWVLDANGFDEIAQVQTIDCGAIGV